MNRTVLRISKDPYRLPDGIYNFLNVSGGRTSAFMLYKILERYQGKHR